MLTSASVAGTLAAAAALPPSPWLLGRKQRQRGASGRPVLKTVASWLLPRCPALEELRAHAPSIAQLPEDPGRPFWSVMIPTYNSGDYLRSTLQSVLCQAPGVDQMQIEVVDGCSTQDRPEKIVEELGRGRVAFHRLASNRGPAHTFNRCIERSRGRWVHILHGDDMIRPGFYDAYAAVIQAHPEAGSVLGQSVLVDEDGRWLGLFGAMPPVGGGILADFTQRQATEQLVLFPAVVVRRDTYERAGGFSSFFAHVTDWDMWFRLGRTAPVAWVAQPYALSRVHGGSDTSRQMVSAANIRDHYLVILANLARLDPGAPASQEPAWRSRLARFADVSAWELDERNSTEGRYHQARWAWMLEPTPSRLVMLLKSWAKHKLRARPATSAQSC